MEVQNDNNRNLTFNFQAYLLGGLVQHKILNCLIVATPIDSNIGYRPEKDDEDGTLGETTNYHEPKGHYR